MECTLKSMSRQSIQKIKAMRLCIEYGILFVDAVDMKIKACNAFNAIYVDTQYKTHPHIPTHNFLNIQPIFNPKKVLQSWDWGLFNHNTIYVNTVNTRQGSLMHSMLSILTLSIHFIQSRVQFSHLITLYTVLCKSHKHQCQQCQQTKHSMHCMLWSSCQQCRQTT